MQEPVILRTSGNPVRMSFLLAVLTGEGLEADLRNVRIGIWWLLVRADQAETARSLLRDAEASLA